jgi:hypothetical protein
MLKIGLDLDNCVNYKPEFFSVFTQALKQVSEIHIVTHRENSAVSRQETETELKELGIFYHHLEITGEKADYILRKKIDVYVDDTDEYFQHLPESVFVLKVREPGNFEFDTSRWIYSKKTGIDIDQ